MRSTWLLCATGLIACSAVVDGRIRPADSGAGFDGGFDGGFDSGPDARPDGAPDASELDVGPDAPDIDAGPACDPSELADESGVFVSARAPNDEGTGGPMSPARSLDRALRLATERGAAIVYLDAGTFAEGVTLTIDADLTVSGGWRAAGGMWMRDCSEEVIDETVVAPPAGARFDVTTTDGELTLSRFTIRGADVLTAGTSSHALAFRSEAVSRLVLDRMRLVAGRGAAGARGMGGGRGANAGLATVCEDGAARGNGGSGAPGAIGSFEADGYRPVFGGPGVDGQPGRHGNAPTTAPESSSSCLPGCAGECNSMAGMCFNGVPMSRTANPGRCGGGGGPGTRGLGGGGGGGSFALYVSGFNVVVTAVDSELTAGAGGNGGAGGEGGDGGAGAEGQRGTNVDCPTACGQSGPSGPTCACGFTSSRSLVGGSAGGRGADGGDGGDGGGGAGGPSAAVVLVGGARFEGPATLDPGTPGMGAGGAENGTSAEVLEP